MTLYSENISQGIDFLYKSQNENGNYPGNIFFINNKKWIDSPGTIFSTSVITHCLKNISASGYPDENNRVKCNKLIIRSLDLFIREMKMPGLWRFGIADDPKWNRLPYDIDDTCCVSFLLKNYHPYIHFGLNEDIIVKNRNSEGLFYTWIIPTGSEKPNVIDSVVNVNACLYLGNNDITWTVSNFICSIISNGREKGSFYYYKNEYQLYYMVSRAYKGGVTRFNEVIKVISAKFRNEHEPENSVDAAIKLTTMKNFGIKNVNLENMLLEFIIKTQRSDGSWDKFPFYQGEEYPNPIGLFFGSPAITTALCLEALI